MELRQLRYVIATADSGNFTRASERCGITQPSLSQQILELEKELGHKLFHRLGRRAVPTEAGAVFIERARKVLFEVETAARELSDSPSLERRITVGATPTMAPYVLPPLIQRCQDRYPNLSVDVIEDFRSNLTRGIIDGELDLALVTQPAKDSRIFSERLGMEKLMIVVAKSHRLNSLKEVRVADLANETFVLLGSSSALSEQIRGFFGTHNFQPRVSCRCSQVSTVKALVGIGEGISLLPPVARAARDEATLSYLSLIDASPSREVCVIRHVQRYQSRGAQQFLALVKEHAPEWIEVPPSSRS